MKLPSLTAARYFAGIAIALAIVALCGLGALIIIRGGVTVSAPSVTGLITAISALATLLVAALGGGAVVNAVGGMQKALNGHLEASAEQAHPSEQSTGTPVPPGGGESHAGG